MIYYLSNIKTGICQHRAQMKEPCFFVEWRYAGVNAIQFHRTRWQCEDQYQSLCRMRLRLMYRTKHIKYEKT